VKDDKEKELKKKEQAAAIANKNLDKIKECEGQLLEQQALNQKNVANPPKKNQKKLTTP
jgi:hypothetical protein